MLKVKIIHVVGARPNFMKVAPMRTALARFAEVSQILVHTGQHYDANMSEIFFQQLEMPAPDINLEVGSGSHATQTAQIMMRWEEIALTERPDLVLVYGDVNSTVAAALVCAKLQIPVGHVEAGLRSFDRTMPEEINRLLTDQIADLLFTPSKDGNENLMKEGVPSEKIHLVGNVMIDTLVRLLPRAQNSKVFESLDLQPKNYGLITLHRPGNVDEPGTLTSILAALQQISREIPLIFPIHPRTRTRLGTLDYPSSRYNHLRLLEPLGYLDFLRLQQEAALVITDSGGIQEESTFLGVPCLTVRENTERPITVELGTNVIVGQDMDFLMAEVSRILNGHGKAGTVPPLWDGRAGERIADIVVHTNF